MEDKFQSEQKTTAATSHFEERCSACPGLQAQNDQLAQEIQEMEEKMGKMSKIEKIEKKDETVDPSYKSMMEIRL